MQKTKMGTTVRIKQLEGQVLFCFFIEVFEESLTSVV